MAIKPALTLQKDGLAINVNFLTDDSVYVSYHRDGAVDLPHNCTGLSVYDYADFERMADDAFDDGATVFYSVGDQDLPLPDSLICR
jgi:hypothetical protein